MKTMVCICCGKQYPADKMLHCVCCGSRFCERCAAMLKECECAAELTYFD